MVGMILDKIRKRILKLKNKINREKRRKWHLRLKMAEFKDDPNFDFKLVDLGLRPHFTVAQNEKDILQRIVSSYRKAHERQKEVDPCFHVSNEWVPIYNKSMGEVRKALLSGDYLTLQRIYQNFMRDPCSTGLAGLTSDMKKDFFSGRVKKRYKLMYLIDLLHRYKVWKGLLGYAHAIDALSSPYIGNPYGIYINGVFMKGGADYLHYYSTAIRRLLRNEKRRVVVELGGGYGGMAYYLLRDGSDITYIDFDLPENMALTAYYLLSSFPEKKILLYGESETGTKSIHKYDALIMPNYEIVNLPEQSADLAFNSYSLAEMSPEAIQRYINEFNRIVRKYILHINHTKHSIVSADKFGIESLGFDLLYKVPALWNAGRNPDMDEYEYLYEKSISKIVTRE